MKPFITHSQILEQTTRAGHSSLLLSNFNSDHSAYKRLTNISLTEFTLPFNAITNLCTENKYSSLEKQCTTFPLH